MTPYRRIGFRAVSAVVMLLTLSTGHTVLAVIYAFLWSFEESQRRRRGE